MKHMKKEKRNPRSHELIREMIELYHPQSIKDIQEMLKDMFADKMEDMLKAELDTELGYSKNSQAYFAAAKFYKRKRLKTAATEATRKR